MKNSKLLLLVLALGLAGCGPNGGEANEEGDQKGVPRVEQAEITEKKGNKTKQEKQNNKEEEKEEAEEVSAEETPITKVKKSEVIIFGGWNPTTSRQVLGRVQAEKEIEVLSDASGKVSRILIDLGDEVQAGQVVARFETANQTTAIVYQNAIGNAGAVQASAMAAVQQAKDQLASTKLSLGEEIRKAEVALEAAKRDAMAAEKAAKVSISNAQANKKASDTAENKNIETIYQSMESATRVTDENIKRSEDYFDRIFRLSSRRKTVDFDFPYDEIGNGDILARSRLEKRASDFVNRPPQIDYQNNNDLTQDEILAFANQRIKELERIERLYDELESLTRGTLIRRDFSEENRQSILSQAAAENSQINGVVSNLRGLKKQIIAAKERVYQSEIGSFTQVKQAESSLEQTVEGSKSRVSQAESNLESTRASASAQIAQLQSAIDSALAGANLQQEQADSQVRVAAANQEDLVIRAPFSGTVTAMHINTFAQVTPGTPIFTLIDKAGGHSVVASLSSDEAGQMSNASNAMLTFTNNESKRVSVSASSQSLNPKTQKMDVEFEIGDLPEGVVVGSLVQVALPVNAGSVAGILPVSAISFEPSGAEVLIVNEEGQAERRKIEVGELLGDSISVTSGIDPGNMVIKYRTRVSTGDFVSPIN